VDVGAEVLVETYPREMEAAVKCTRWTIPEEEQKSSSSGGGSKNMNRSNLPPGGQEELRRQAVARRRGLLVEEYEGRLEDALVKRGFKDFLQPSSRLE